MTSRGDECELHPCKTPHARLLPDAHARRRRGFLRWYLDGTLAFEVSSSSLGAYAEEPRPSVEVDPDFVYPNSTAWLAPRVTAAARLESARLPPAEWARVRRLIIQSSML